MLFVNAQSVRVSQEFEDASTAPYDAFEKTVFVMTLDAEVPETVRREPVHVQMVESLWVSDLEVGEEEGEEEEASNELLVMVDIPEMERRWRSDEEMDEWLK